MEWNSDRVRRTFLDYFVKNNHKEVKSCPLVPANDPTLLFTNAGMVQFKDYFTGKAVPPFRRATSSQKCVRAGGKHNDLENVGRTARHHTFFEMLGNFSFGDYFKKEAIRFAWELVTEYYRLPVERLWITIYEKDEEAKDIWKEVSGLPDERIVKCGAKDNFWEMGDTGPCGPCSEIHFDLGEHKGCRRKGCSVVCECDRFQEIWNLVFMQYEKKEDGTIVDLPSPSIDTGLGLERLCAILQGVDSNYDTDLFLPIIKSICELWGVEYKKDDAKDVSIRVIADHIRAVTFLVADGVMPSNEGRGYVLRRILRRAIRHSKMLGASSPIIYNLCHTVIDLMGHVYPEIVENRDVIAAVTREEEERFLETLGRGLVYFRRCVKEIKEKNESTISGRDTFTLYDTYGFPLDLTLLMAEEHGLSVDVEGFESFMQQQRNRSKWSDKGGTTTDVTLANLYNEIGDTVFVGYERLQDESEVVAIVVDGKIVDSISEGEKGLLITKKTPFYAESGGQVGDTGTVMDGDDRLIAKVENTTYGYQKMIVHHINVKNGEIKKGERVNLVVDKERRLSIMRNHSATHLLHYALRKVLGTHVKQAGSLVAPDRLRFDFTHFRQLTDQEIKEVEDTVNSMILSSIEGKTEVLPIEEARKKGAMSLFGEKYGDVVRVVEFGESKEFCGGTHLENTSKIGLFKIVSESSVGSGLRRIEAITADAIVDYIRDIESRLKEVAFELKSDIKSITTRIRKLREENRKLIDQIQKLKFGSGSTTGWEIEKVGEFSFIVDLVDTKDMNELRMASDSARTRIKSGITILFNNSKKRAGVVVAATKDLENKIDCTAILKKITKEFGGGGGGNRLLAQGGGIESSKIGEAIKFSKKLIKEHLTGIESG